jgi:hypothetical protein
MPRAASTMLPEALVAESEPELEGGVLVRATLAIRTVPPTRPVTWPSRTAIFRWPLVMLGPAVLLDPGCGG